jgi:RimJ/RimL family protein N-acetyltransferase
MPSARSDGRVLRSLEQGDLELIRCWHNTPDVRKGTFAFPFPASIEAEKAWYDRNVSAGDGRNAIFGILADSDGHEIIGLAMLRNIDWISRAAWFGVFVGNTSMRNKGHARKAATAILNFGFGDLGLNRIALEVSVDNAGAVRLYESIGFKHEGVLRQARFIDGQFVDVLLMAKLLRADP